MPRSFPGVFLHPAMNTPALGTPRAGSANGGVRGLGTLRSGPPKATEARMPDALEDDRDAAAAPDVEAAEAPAVLGGDRGAAHRMDHDGGQG